MPNLEENKESKHIPLNEITDSIILEGKEHPQNLPPWRKWLAVFVICFSSFCVTCASSLAAFTEEGVSKEFKVGITVSVLSISLFVIGLGIGPLIVGPLSEIYGRNPIYQTSFGLFFIFSWPVAFAPNIATLLVFRLFTGFCGAAFLSVAGGSISDLFSDATVMSPMALYTISPFLGPVIGPLIGGFINQSLNWRWTYYLLIIWTFVQFLALVFLVPETYIPVLLKAKVKRYLQAIGRQQDSLENDKTPKALLNAILVSCHTPFKLLLLDRMALFLAIWNALILGTLYLAFQVYPIIFQQGHNFNLQETGLGFLGIGLGMVIGLLTQPAWNRFYSKTKERHGGILPPESRLYTGQVGAVCVPIGLFWLAFTTYPSVHWSVPIVASIPFGCGIYLVFTSSFTYIVITYRPIAASAMAANSAMRSTFAAVFPLFANAMYKRLGTVGATALLAGLTTIMAPLPIGPQLRRKSPFAV